MKLAFVLLDLLFVKEVEKEGGKSYDLHLPKNVCRLLFSELIEMVNFFFFVKKKVSNSSYQHKGTMNGSSAELFWSVD